MGGVPPTPLRKVQFRHPATGETTEGHIHAASTKGATIVDGHGQTHKVPHGDYMHAETPGAGGEAPKPRADLVTAAARKHLELGLNTPLAVHAAAALLVAGGVHRAHALQSQQVAFEDGYALIKPDKLRTNEAPLVQALQQLQKKNPRGPIFQLNGEPITEQSLTLYVQRFGGAHGPTVPGAGAGGAQPAPPKAAPPPAPAGPQPMAKAAASALELPPDLGEALMRWVIGGYVCKFRKGASGLGVVTVEQDGMPLPWHEVTTQTSAQRVAREAVDAISSGRSPARGVFQAVR